MKVVRAETFLVDLEPEVVRFDAIQQFTKQETIFVQIETDDGFVGTGYSYTIGTGGNAVIALLRVDLLPRLIGEDARKVEGLWSKLVWATHGTAVGAITSLALAAVDTALWDIRCKAAAQPLWLLAGGYRERVPLYDTEGGWLNIEIDEVGAAAKRSVAKGWPGVKVKVGKPNAMEDVARLTAVREAIGPDIDLMVDANQSFTYAEAKKRARLFEPLNLYWFEEPMPAEDMSGHVELARSTSIPVAVGESIYSLSHFREYLAVGACGIVQVDVARIGGITPWLKTAHLAESFNVKVAPHFLMELHVSLCAAVPNARWVEYIPQIDTLTLEPMQIEDGHAIPSDAPGLGIAWDFAAIKAQTVPGSSFTIG